MDILVKSFALAMDVLVSVSMAVYFYREDGDMVALITIIGMIVNAYFVVRG